MKSLSPAPSVVQRPGQRAKARRDAEPECTKSADLGPTATNLMHLGMALLESGQKDRARAVFRKAKSFKTKGAGLEEKILEQFRSTTKLIDRLHARRRKVAKG